MVLYYGITPSDPHHPLPLPFTVPGADIIAKRTGAKVIANGEAIRGQ